MIYRIEAIESNFSCLIFPMTSTKYDGSKESILWYAQRLAELKVKERIVSKGTTLFVLQNGVRIGTVKV